MIPTCKPLRILCLLSFIAHTALAVVIWFAIGTFGSNPAWDIMGRFVSEYVWPAMFFAIGISALCGIWYRPLARISFWWGAVVMWIWTIALVIYWEESKIPQTGAVFLLYVGGLKASIAELMLREEKVVNAVHSITHQLQDVITESRSGSV